MQKEKEEFERQEKARMEGQELERKKLERQDLEKRDSEEDSRQAAVEAQQLQQAPQQEAQASAWQALIFLHGSAISATQDHTSFLEGKQSHESNRCP